MTVDPARQHALAGGTVGVALLLGLWLIMSGSQPEVILPTPPQTWDALVSQAVDGTLAANLTITVYRAALGVGAALLIGLAWGGINGASPWSAAISHPTISTLMAVPPVVIVALGLIWFGPGDTAISFVIVLVALPLIVVTVQEAVRAVDHELLEMAATFGVRRTLALRHIVAPAVASPVLAATSVSFGQALRAAVMAELLGSTTGVGARVGLARSNLETADLFAWTLAIIALVLVIESALLRPFRSRLLRWRAADEQPPALSPNPHQHQ